MTESELKQLLQRVTTGSAAVAKDAQKQIQAALKPNRPENRGALVDVYLDTIRHYQNDPAAKQPHNQMALVSLMNAFGWMTDAEERLDNATEFVLQLMTHPSGNVRERARSGANTFRFALLGPMNVLEPTDGFRQYVARLEELLAEHRPAVVPHHIDTMPPSVFKTLVMHWCELGRGVIGTQFVNMDRAQSLRLPIYAQLDDEWLAENEPTQEDESENLWDYLLKKAKKGERKGKGAKNTQGRKASSKTAKDFRSITRALQALQAGARSRLVQSLSKVGYTETGADRSGDGGGGEKGEDMLTLIEESIAEDGDEGALAAFLAVGTDYATKRHGGNGDYRQALRELHSVLRDTQLLSKHTVLENSSGQPYSELLAECALAKALNGRHIPDDWEQFVYLLRDAHQAIDDFHRNRHTEVITETEASFADLRKKFPDLEIPSMLQPPAERPSRAAMTDIAHYALDWYAMLEPWAVTKRPPHQLAALALYIVRQTNYNDTDHSEIDFTMDELARLGGWKTSSSVSSAGHSAYYGIIYQLEDPELLNLSGKSPLPSARDGNDS